MTKTQAIEWVKSTDDGDAYEDECKDAFRAIFGREPNDDDRDQGIWFHLCAAVSVMRNPNPAAVALGRLGGKSRSPAKLRAAARNAKLGGWPKGRPRKVSNIIASVENSKAKADFNEAQNA